MEMGSLKAPGPDGYQPFFFKQYWHLVCEEVWHLVNDAFLWDTLDSNIVETLIVLIPKVDHPSYFKSFKLISLCNVVHKIIIKVLVNRLHLFLEDIISPLQGSFIPGRRTTDNIIVAQEVLNHMHKFKERKSILAFNLDMEMAYDSLSQDFPENTLIDFGFSQCTIKLIMSYVQSSSLFILWNGSNLETFTPTRRLHQGDPLSPYLFILCMEKLSLFINQKVGEGVWKPIHVSRGGQAITILSLRMMCYCFVTVERASPHAFGNYGIIQFCFRVAC